MNNFTAVYLMSSVTSFGQTELKDFDDLIAIDDEYQIAGTIP